MSTELTNGDPCPQCGAPLNYDNDVGANDDYFIEWLYCSRSACDFNTRWDDGDWEIEWDPKIPDSPVVAE